MYYGTTPCLFLQSSFDNSLTLSCGLVIWFSWFLVNMRLSMSCGYYWCWVRLRRNRLGILLQIGAASLTDGERNDKRPCFAFPVAHSAHCIAILFLALHLFFLLMLVCILLLRVGGFLFRSSIVCTIFVLNLICGFPSVLYIYTTGSILKRERCCCSCDVFQWRRVSKSFCWIQYWSNIQYINQNFLIVSRLPLAYTCW
jgi:hypothetical protein